MASEAQGGVSSDESGNSARANPLRVVTAAAIFDGHDAAI